MPACRVIHVTPPQPGAIAIILLAGDVEPALTALTGIGHWPIGRMRCCPLGEVDDGLAGRVTESTAQVMPHGGPRVVQRLVERLVRDGAEPGDGIDASLRYPEAADDVEAAMLAALARAHSPLGIELLLDQPRRWRDRSLLTDADRLRSKRLDRLIDPPTVVLAGPSNVGKSTLSNALLGRSMSIELDAPGTTRDYTAGLIELEGVVVVWHDTPGLRTAECGADDVELEAIELARRVMAGADLLIAITDAEHDWPTLPRSADLRVASKADLAMRSDADLAVSARTGAGLTSLVRAARDRLVPPEDLAHPGPWLFTPLPPGEGGGEAAG